MQFKTNAPDRKTVVKIMEEILNQKSIYMGPPSFGYEVGVFRIDRNGMVETESEKEGEWMQNELIARGLTEAEKDKLNIDIPLEGITADALKNLIYIIHSKQYLLERSVGMKVLGVSDSLVDRLGTAEELAIEEMITIITEEENIGISFLSDRIRFSGFPFSVETANVYTELISNMVKAAKEQKRINPAEVIEENEKYYMRSWLVRIGFGGKDGKEARKVLLSNLKGHTAFRTSEDEARWKERYAKKGEQ